MLELPFNFDVINTFVGILHTSSQISYTTNKTDTLKKEFTPFINMQHKILVKTKIITQCPDRYAIVKFESYDAKTNSVTCLVHEFLGNVSDQPLDKVLKALATSFWTKKYDKLCQDIVSIDLTPNRSRFDPTIEIYSIDPEGCIDIDDALHCIKTNSGWQVGIHIADVSSWIEEKSILDIELSKRIETFYSDHHILPNQNMIPDVLSINCCSLLQGFDKRSFSVIIDYDEHFNILNIQFFKALINVKKNLSYERAQELIETKQNETLCNLYNAGSHLFKGEITQYDTHEMVAVFMIEANKCVAEYISRIAPSFSVLRVQNSSSLKSSVFNENKVLNTKYQNSLYEKATYKIGFDDNSCHSTLGLKSYTHFTSPIRRYVDILVHRMLYKLISETQTEMLNIDNGIIERANFYSKYYKHLQMHTKLLSCIENLDEVSEFEAHIISLKSDLHKIRVYIESLDLEIDIKVLHRKLSQVLENISGDENELVIINTQTLNGVTFKVFQKIKIQLVLTSNLFNPVNVTILEPNVSSILEIN